MGSYQFFPAPGWAWQFQSRLLMDSAFYFKSFTALDTDFKVQVTPATLTIMTLFPEILTPLVWVHRGRILPESCD